MESRKHSRDWDHERPLEGHGITKKDESRLDNSEGGGDEDIVPQIFRNGRIRSNSLGEVSVEGNGKKKGSKPNSISPMGKRRITWADGTAEPRQSQLAVTIPRHRNTVIVTENFSITLFP